MTQESLRGRLVSAGLRCANMPGMSGQTEPPRRSLEPVAPFAEKACSCPRRKG
jgi:hypothetical protein